jgi:tetratricopeptide (TPR) repeat protein
MSAGITACREGKWRTGHQILVEVAQHEDSNDPYPGYFYGYLGVAMGRVEGRKREAVELCRYGVELDPEDPEGRLNLARAYLLTHRRKPAVQQLAIGLRLSPGNSQLRALREEIGYRRKPFIPFLSRDFFLNQWVGRLTWKMHKQQRELRELEELEAEVDRLAKRE